MHCLDTCFDYWEWVGKWRWACLADVVLVCVFARINGRRGRGMASLGIPGQIDYMALLNHLHHRLSS
jgi:hypothetical protein